jgi:hypothetical protein
MGVESARVAPVKEWSCQPDERVLHKVLREGSVPSQKVRQSQGFPGVTSVELRQHAPFDPDHLHVHPHSWSSAVSNAQDHDLVSLGMERGGPVERGRPVIGCGREEWLKSL